MTDEDKKRIYEYCGYNESGFKGNNITGYVKFNFDGNDMVEAMNKMRFTISNEFDNEWQEFFYNSFNGGVVADTCFDLCSNPARFFELMSSWLKEKHEKS